MGRIKTWIKYPNTSHPISCRQITLEDSMEGESGIEYGIAYVSRGLRFGSGVAVDFSKLRAEGQKVGSIGNSSGPVPFLKIFSTLNETLRRGGEYKNGAVVSYINLSHPDAEAYLRLDRSEIPWLKRALYVSEHEEDPDYLLTHPLYPLIIQKVSEGQLWLAKKRWECPSTGHTLSVAPYPPDPYKYRINSQVCTEVEVPSRGTCTLTPINIGKLTPREIIPAYKMAARFLHHVHSEMGASRGPMDLPTAKDKQVGIGIIGLSNYLARYKLPYALFAAALDAHVYDRPIVPSDFAELTAKQRKVLFDTVSNLWKAHHVAANYLRERGYKRAFAIAPSANVSYNHTDLQGYTCSPEISPPVCHPETKLHTRVSATFGAKTYQYHPDAETALEVGFPVYFKLATAWQTMMESTGMAHAISFNVHDTVDVAEFLPKWLSSSLVSTYYRFPVDQTASTAKDNIAAIIGGVEQPQFEVPVACDITYKFGSPESDPNYCAACSG